MQVESEWRFFFCLFLLLFFFFPAHEKHHSKTMLQHFPKLFYNNWEKKTYEHSSKSPEAQRSQIENIYAVAAALKALISL